ncbi:IS21-like element helper ATPase IstB [Paenibacillus thalictri]|uniref:AAA family ATPase n=1 Tax=Paenibacillus thalictri TaxID=2527873 RepID=A0A4Q9DE63_9BACL|nr:IS21-like element helper ATPase IstB [Paenibacillus thalictri]TBL67345.1 AAA family ATPase [Paenibacillus thalictri]
MVTHLLVEAYAKRLRLPTIKRQFRELAKDAAERQIPYEDFLAALLEQEVLQRDANFVASRIKAARFPQAKTLDQFEFQAIPTVNKPKVLQLARCEYLEKAENVIFLGNSGTGKTHLAIALGMEACRQGYSVQFWTAARLCNELLEAQSEKRLLALEKQWLKADLVIVDEVGYVPLTKTGAELFFQQFAARHERGSTIVTSNLEFADWTQVFKDEQMTAALVDRLTHRSHIFAMNGDSYRFKQSMQALRS